MSNSVLIKSSLAKKYWMAITGLFLCSFLVVHLIGNLQLLYNDLGESFNIYAKFMTSNPLVKTISYILYASILFHAIDGILLVMQNKAARPVKYAYNKPEANSVWTSRYMGILGTIILVFIVGHMKNFWYLMHFGDIQMVTIDGEQYKNLYQVVVSFYKESGMGLFYVILYTSSMIALGFHLSHGFQSAFQSLGLNHAKYTPVIKKVGIIFSIVIPLMYALIPISLYLKG